MTAPLSRASTARRTLRGSGWSGLIASSIASPAARAGYRGSKGASRAISAGAARLPCTMTLSQLELPLWLARVFAFVWGCLWASFVNVVVYRVPREMSVVRPASHCPACGAPVHPIDNLPVVSWLVLRGRARCCGARISPRYVVVELLGGVLSLAIAEVVVRALPADTTLVHAGSIFLADFALAMALLA